MGSSPGSFSSPGGGRSSSDSGMYSCDGGWGISSGSVGSCSSSSGRSGRRSSGCRLHLSEHPPRLSRGTVTPTVDGHPRESATKKNHGNFVYYASHKSWRGLNKIGSKCWDFYVNPYYNLPYNPSAPFVRSGFLVSYRIRSAIKIFTKRTSLHMTYIQGICNPYKVSFEIHPTYSQLNG